MAVAAPARRIALFGGSFNPPHLGHVLCATWAKLQSEVDEVWVLPVAEHPYGKDLPAFDRRCELCRLAFADLDFVTVSDAETRNPGGRTVTLVERLAAEHPAVIWYLIGGTDTGRDLAHWYRGTDLLRLVRVIAVPRRGYDDDHPAALPAISSTLVRRRLAAGEAIDDLVPHRVATSLRRSSS